MVHEVFTIVSDLLFFLLLHVQKLLCLAHLYVVVAQTIDLGLQLVVSRCNALGLLEARTTEMVTREIRLGQ